LPLPKHCGWNKDPVGKRAKAAKIADAKVAKAAKASIKRQNELDAEAAKEKLAEMEVDESFSQKEEVQWHVCWQSDVENMGASNSNDKDSELPDLADMGVSDDDADSSNNDTEGAGNDTEGAKDAADDDQGSLQ
jgi:hypothetical protein